MQVVAAPPLPQQRETLLVCVMCPLRAVLKQPDVPITPEACSGSVARQAWATGQLVADKGPPPVTLALK